MSRGSLTRRFCGEFTVNAPALAIGQDEFTTAIGDAIRRAAARHPFGFKFIQRAANANSRTVENWAAKLSAPSGLYLVRLMATVPEVQAEVRRLAAMEADFDPEMQRDLLQLMQTTSRLMQAKARG